MCLPFHVNITIVYMHHAGLNITSKIKGKNMLNTCWRKKKSKSSGMFCIRWRCGDWEVDPHSAKNTLFSNQNIKGIRQSQKCAFTIYFKVIFLYFWFFFTLVNTTSSIYLYITKLKKLFFNM